MIDQIQHALDMYTTALLRWQTCRALQKRLEDNWQLNVELWRKASKTKRKTMVAEMTASWYEYRASVRMAIDMLSKFETESENLSAQMRRLSQQLGENMPDEFRADWLGNLL